MHEHIWISIDHEGDWLLEMRTPCRNISSNFKCKIYKNRPQICRDYPGEDELCERQTEELSYKRIFKNEKELEKYLIETQPSHRKN
jgi:Fe-S-cluster containining protein